MKARKLKLVKEGKYRTGMNIKDDIANLSISGEFRLSDYFELEEEQECQNSESSSNRSSSSSSSSDSTTSLKEIKKNKLA